MCFDHLHPIPLYVFLKCFHIAHLGLTIPTTFSVHCGTICSTTLGNTYLGGPQNTPPQLDGSFVVVLQHSSLLPHCRISSIDIYKTRGLRLPSQRTGFIGDGWKGSRIGKTREQHILELWSLLKGGQAMVNSSLKDNL